MIFYMALQLRNQAGALQVPNVKYAMTHNLGLGGSAFVSVLKRADFYEQGDDPSKRFGYNIADECRRITGELKSPIVETFPGGF